MRVVFEVLGEPQGKGRPRFSSKSMRTYTPEKTARYENLIHMEYLDKCGFRFPDDAMLRMCITAIYSIPKSASKKKRQAMLDGEIRPTKKPDSDNVVKVVADSLNNVAYRDDVQIVDCCISKYYGEVPKIVVTIESIDPQGQIEG